MTTQPIPVRTAQGWDPPPERRRSRALVPVLVVAGVLLLLAVGYVVAALALADRVPGGTSVGGVDVGGRSQAEAIAELETAFAERAAEPVPVSVGGAPDTLDPVAAGLSLDARTSVGGLTGFSLSPARLWRHAAGGDDVPVASTIDEGALTSALTSLAQRVDTPATDGAVTFVGGAPQAVVPAPGRGLDVAAASDVVRREWLAGSRPVELPVAEVPPAVDQAAVDAALAAAQQVVAAPVTVAAAGRQVSVPPQLFADTLSYTPDGEGGLALGADGERLREAVLALDPRFESTPVDASVVLQDGAPVVVPGVDGVTLEAAPLAAAVTEALQGDRQADVEAAGREPDLTTAEAEALGIREVVSTFSTPYPNNPARTENLRIAAETIDGYIVQPGEVFSLNDVLGERTADKGYQEAGVIENGRYTSGRGGGVSQVSTTVYNATFFAGLEDITHKPHSFYISRYPEGREATLNWDPRVENQFRNDTDYGILIQAYLSGGQITVTYWSTKVWDVEAVTSERFNFRQPETVYDTDADCEDHESSVGFDVTVTRIWRQNGAEVRRESQTTVYQAAPNVICGPRP